jgi:hypothetical protein
MNLVKPPVRKILYPPLHAPHFENPESGPDMNWSHRAYKNLRCVDEWAPSLKLGRKYCSTEPYVWRENRREIGI